MSILNYNQTFENKPNGLFFKLKAKKPSGNREVIYKALFDTGAMVSGITQKIVDDLGLEKVQEVRMGDANGKYEMRPTYLVNLIFPTKPDTFEFRSIEVPLTFSTQGENILLGMNIISRCNFSLSRKESSYHLNLEIDTENCS